MLDMFLASLLISIFYPTAFSFLITVVPVAHLTFPLGLTPNCMVLFVFVLVLITNLHIKDFIRSSKSVAS